MTVSTRYEDAAARRDSILEYLRANPGATLSHIMRALGIKKAKAGQTLLHMRERKEVEYKDGGAGLSGRTCRAYYAKAKRSLPAEVMGSRGNAADKRRRERGRVKPSSKPAAVKRLFGGLDL